MIFVREDMAKVMKAFGKKQRRVEPTVRKAPKYRRLSGEAKKQIFFDMDLGVSLKPSTLV